MSTQTVADRYYELMQADQRDQVVAELYGDDMTDHEPEHAAKLGIPTLTQGLAAVKAKLAARAQIIEAVHSNSCTRPVVGGSFFSVALGRDLTLKGRPRTTLSEIAVYEVRDGKIVSARYFY